MSEGANRNELEKTMSRYDQNEFSFRTTENTLEDGSKTYDVYFSDDIDQMLIAEAPSQQTAEELSAALNAIRERFLDCGSDREVVSFACSFDRFMATHNKKAA